MKQEEKSLLLQDLCARLPYDVVVRCYFVDGEGEEVLDTDDIADLLYNEENSEFPMYKPYLRPMSSITQEEIDEYDKELGKDMDIIENGVIDKEKLIASNGNCSSMNFIPHYGNDWLNKKMFDYRGLIGKNLALKALKDMYNN